MLEAEKGMLCIKLATACFGVGLFTWGTCWETKSPAQPPPVRTAFGFKMPRVTIRPATIVLHGDKTNVELALLGDSTLDNTAEDSRGNIHFRITGGCLVKSHPSYLVHATTAGAAIKGELGRDGMSYRKSGGSFKVMVEPLTCND